MLETTGEHTGSPLPRVIQLCTVLIALTLVSYAVGAHAAEITALSGQASASKGYGFKAIAVGTQLQAGDQVLVSKDSETTISFYEDCEITVYAGETYRIPEDPQCEPAGYVAPEGLSQAALLGISLAGAGAIIGIGAWIALASGDNDGAPIPAASP